MKVVILTASCSKKAGGVAEAVKQLACQLMYCPEIEMSVLSHGDSLDTKEKESIKHLPVEFFNISNIPLLKSIGFSWSLNDIINKIKPDIIDAQGLWMYHSYITLRQNKKGIKTIVTPHGMLDEWAINNSKMKKKIAAMLFENENLRNADCIKALNEAEYKSIRHYGLKNPVAIIPNGVLLPPSVSKNQLLGDKKTLLFLGRIHPKKGIKELIEGVDFVNKKKPELLNSWRIRIAGWGQIDYVEYINHIIKNKGLDSIISFIGPVFNKDKEDEYRNANAFILPSFSEGLPMSVLEAWSYQLPVIMTEHCNLPEGFINEAAIKIDPNPDSIANSLISFFNMNNDRMERMGKNGYELVCNKFSWESVADKTLCLYKWVLNTGPMPDFVRID